MVMNVVCYEQVYFEREPFKNCHCFETMRAARVKDHGGAMICFVQNIATSDVSSSDPRNF